MKKESDLGSAFTSLKALDKISVCFLAINIDHLRQKDLSTCLKKFYANVFSLSLASHDSTAAIHKLLDNRVIKKSANGLYCTDSIKTAALLEALNKDYFEEMAMILQAVSPNHGTVRGDMGGRNYYKSIRDLQISIFRNDPIEDISKTLLDLYQQFPEKCSEVHPLFLILDDPFSTNLLYYITSFNRILLLGNMISQAEENLTPVNHILDYLSLLYRKGEFEIPVTDLLSALFVRGRFKEIESILHQKGVGEKRLPQACRQFFRGCLAFVRDDNAEAIDIFRKVLPSPNSSSNNMGELPKGYPAVFPLLAFLKNSSRKCLLDGVEYLKILEKEQYLNYYRYCLNLKEVFYDQLGLPTVSIHSSPLSSDVTKLPVKQRLPGRHKYLLDEFFYILTLWWFDREAATNNTTKIETIRDRSLKGEYLWLAAESASLLAAFNNENTGDQALAWRIHKNLGSVSIVNIVQEIPKWEKTLNALLHINPAGNEGEKPESSRTRLVWWFRYNDYERSCSLQPRLQKFTKSGKWSKGRPLSLKQLYTEPHSLECLSEQDLKICRTISETVRPEGGWNYHGPRVTYAFNLKETLPALIGHSLVFLADSPEVRIDFVHGEPVVRVIKDGQATKLSIEPGPGTGSDKEIQIIRENPTRFRVIRFNEQQKYIQDVIGNEGVVFPENADASLQEALSSVSSIVTIQSDLGSIGGKVRVVETDSRPHIQLLPYREGLKLEILVKPIAGANAWFNPGEDGRNVMAEINNIRVQARRNLEKERQLTERLLVSCPTLQRKYETSYDTVNEIIVEDPEECLEILQELNECQEDVVLEWPKGERFRLRKNIADSDLSLHIRQDRNWFKANGSLEVDEDFSMELSELMDRLDTSKGRFVPLDDGSFLALTREFHKRLEELRTFSSRAGKGMKFHPLTAPALTDLTSGVGKLTCDEAWEQHKTRLKDVIEPELPNGLRAELRDYQEAGFKWLAQLSHWGIGGCLADDMGLGKTVQALAAVLLRAPEGPTLVVAPLSVINNWKDEARRFAPSLNIKIFGQGDRQQLLDQLQPFDLVLVSYGLLQVEVERLTGVLWQTVILDEAQAIKNRRTKRSRAAMALQAEFKVITTGTPIENHPGEMWTLFNFINPGLLGSYKHFHENFTIPIERDQDAAAGERLRKLIKPFILRRVKNEVLQELPPRTDVTLQVEMSKQEATLYAAQRSKALQNLKDSTDENRHFRILTEITKLRRLCCNPALVWPETNIAGSKLRVFGDTLSELLDNKHKVLVFSQFVDHLKIIRKYLDSHFIEYQYLDGSTSARQREKSIKNFQAGKGDVFLISLKAGGFGLNLCAADYVIHMDPWWNPAVEDQASDRAHRLGQQRPVTVYRLVMKDSIEEQIVELHTKKRELADSLLKGSDIAGRITTEQLLELLKG